MNVNTTTSVYVARYRLCGCAYGVIVEGRGREREVVEFVTEAISGGDYVDHMTLDEFRANVQLFATPCPSGGKH